LSRWKRPPPSRGLPPSP